MSFFDSIANTSLILWVIESNWGYPIVISAHAIGMSLVVGIILVFCLRVLGFAKAIPLASIKQLMPWLLIGAVINVCSGLMLFFANYKMFMSNTAFITKIILLIIGSIAAWIMNKEIVTPLQTEPSAQTVTLRGKAIAAIYVSGCKATLRRSGCKPKVA